MAVVSCKEISGRSVEIDKNLERKYRRRWRVRVNDPQTTEGTIYETTGIARMYDPYVTPLTYDLGSFCVNLGMEQQEDDSFVWIVTASYEPLDFDPADLGKTLGTQEGAGTGTPQTTKNPLLLPAKIRWSGRQYQRPLRYDLNGEAVVNSAGQPFNPPPEVEASRLVLTISRNQSEYDPALAAQYFDAINSDVFFGRPARSWKVMEISGDSEFDEGLRYWSVTYRFEHRKETWLVKLLDQGLNELVGGELKAIMDKRSASPITEPALLDGSGLKLVSGEDPEYKTYVGYEELPFADLNLP